MNIILERRYSTVKKIVVEKNKGRGTKEGSICMSPSSCVRVQISVLQYVKQIKIKSRLSTFTPFLDLLHLYLFISLVRIPDLDP